MRNECTQSHLVGFLRSSVLSKERVGPPRRPFNLSAAPANKEQPGAQRGAKEGGADCRSDGAGAVIKAGRPSCVYD